MSGMHLMSHAFTTTGKPRGKKRWASSEAKRKAESLRAEWERKLTEIDKLKPAFSGSKNLKPVQKPIPSYSTIVPPGRETPHFKSVDTGWITCTAVKDNEYTGDKIKGISVLHKSNGVPVFNQQEIIDISKMRR